MVKDIDCRVCQVGQFQVIDWRADQVRQYEVIGKDNVFYIWFGPQDFSFINIFSS